MSQLQTYWHFYLWFCFLMHDCTQQHSLGPVYMVSGTRDNPPSRDNFSEHLYENCMTKTKLTLLDYAYILRLILKK